MSHSMETTMEILFEFIFDAVVELLYAGGEAAVRNSKVPKPIRIMIAVIGILIFAAIIGLIVFAGVDIMRSRSVIGGLIIVAVAVLLLVMMVKKVRKGKCN